jgi:hypothetical protein
VNPQIIDVGDVGRKVKESEGVLTTLESGLIRSKPGGSPRGRPPYRFYGR